MSKYIKYSIIALISNLIYCNILAQNNFPDSILIKSIQNKNYKYVLDELKKIRNNEDINYLEPLKNIHINEQENNRFLKVVDSMATIKIELETTILQLELKKAGLKSSKDKTNYLLNLIRDKIYNKTGVVNPELNLLNEDAHVPYLLRDLDNDTSTSLKIIYLSVLENIKANNLENEILNRIELYKNILPVYYKMLVILSNIGGKKANDYYKINIEPNPSISPIIKDRFLQRFDKTYKSTPNPHNETNDKNAIIQQKKPIVESKPSDSTALKPIKVIRPENAGKNFREYNTDSLLFFASQSEDKIVLRKTAKALGDKYIAKELTLAAAEQEIINIFTEKYIHLATSEDPGIREESKLQIERLWHLAVPMLLKNLGSENHSIAELAAKSLILMRNEDIINSIINQANKAVDKNTKNWYISILTKMKEQRTSAIPNRTCLGAIESETLYKNLIVPALDQLKK